MSKRATEADGGPFPPVSGRTPTERDRHEAEIQGGIEDRKFERKRRAGAAALIGAAGENLSEQIGRVLKAIHSTR